MKRATVAELADAAGLKPAGDTLPRAGSKPAGRTRRRIDPLYASVSESAWQAQVVKAARLLGWEVFTVRVSAGRSVGTGRVVSYVTSEGYPDLTLCRPGSPVTFAELKSERGQMSSAQVRWANALRACDGVRYFVWRPSNINQVMEALE